MDCREVAELIDVYALGRNPSPFTQFYTRLQRDPAWHTVTVPCGTDVMWGGNGAPWALSAGRFFEN